MSIKANFYKYSKQIDSTERPTGSGTEFDIVLKGAVSITAPVIELDSAALDYNYCYIPAFGRYYFVQSTTIITADIIEYSLSVDVLATWKTEILDSSCYVLRSASDYNLKLVDDTWTHTTDFSETVSTIALPSYNADGCYIITVVNDESDFSANPASTMYAVNAVEMVGIMGELFNISNYPNIDAMTKTYFNPQQYITSCRWYPFSQATITSGSFHRFKYGWYEADNITAGGNLVTNYGTDLTFSFTLGTYTDWTDRVNDWTRYALYIPGFGTNEIDAAYSGQTISGKISVDWNTGAATCVLTSGSNEIIAVLSGSYGCEVSINQISTANDIPTSKEGLITKGIETGVAFAARARKSGAGKGVISFFKAAAMSGAVGYGTEMTQREMQHTIESGRDIAEAAADAATATILQPTVISKGADGARYSIISNHNIILYRRKYAHYNPAVAKLGGVCNQVKTLSTLSGYTQVANGLIEMTGTVEERNAITSLLEGGFIIA